MSTDELTKVAAQWATTHRELEELERSKMTLQNKIESVRASMKQLQGRLNEAVGRNVTTRVFPIGSDAVLVQFGDSFSPKLIPMERA